MLKKVVVCSVISMFLIGGAVATSFADEMGPEEITIVGTKSKKPKPAVFPHKKHQETLKCAECHHGMADGKQVAYVEGQEIQKCEVCHTGDALAGKTTPFGKRELKLDTIKGAGHGNCLACHKKMVKEDAALKAKKIDKCGACHPKKKK